MAPLKVKTKLLGLSLAQLLWAKSFEDAIKILPSNYDSFYYFNDS